MLKFHLRVNDDRIKLHVRPEPRLKLKLRPIGGGGMVPEYTGTYTVTPSQSTQTLNTNGLKMTSNVTVNPIPSNYGLITWNGSYLTVS